MAGLEICLAPRATSGEQRDPSAEVCRGMPKLLFIVSNENILHFSFWLGRGLRNAMAL